MSKRLAQLLSIEVHLIRQSGLSAVIGRMQSGILMESMSRVSVVDIDRWRVYTRIQGVNFRLFVEVRPERRQTFYLRGQLKKSLMNSARIDVSLRFLYRLVLTRSLPPTHGNKQPTSFELSSGILCLKNNDSNYGEGEATWQAAALLSQQLSASER